MSPLLLNVISDHQMSKLAEAIDDNIYSNSDHILKFTDILMYRLNKNLLCPVSSHQLITWFMELLPLTHTHSEVLNRLESCVTLICRQSKSNLSTCLRAIVRHTIKQVSHIYLYCTNIRAYTVFRHMNALNIGLYLI